MALGVTSDMPVLYNSIPILRLAAWLGYFQSPVLVDPKEVSYVLVFTARFLSPTNRVLTRNSKQ